MQSSTESISSVARNMYVNTQGAACVSRLLEVQDYRGSICVQFVVLNRRPAFDSVARIVPTTGDDIATAKHAFGLRRPSTEVNRKRQPPQPAYDLYSSNKLCSIKWLPVVLEIILAGKRGL